jgi:hypothetical protein
MYNKMAGGRVQATLSGGTDSHLNAFATWDPSTSTANILVYNYDETRVFGSNTSTETPEPFSLNVDHLGNGSVRIERYVIDADNSNLAHFLVNPTYSPELQQKTTVTGTVTGGRLTLSGSLGLGVALYRVLPSGN